MRIRTIASAALGLVVTMALVAACLPDTVPAAGRPRGHEETPLPTATPGPFPDHAPVVKPAARVVEPAPARPAPLPGCRSIAERVQSVQKAAPDAAVYQDLAGPAAAEFVAQYNRENFAKVEADEVAVVVSESWGDRAVVLFERAGCEVGTEQVSFSVPGREDE